MGSHEGGWVCSEANAAVKRQRNGILTDQVGQTSVEYTLLLAGIGLPMMYVFKVLLDTLTAYYQMVTFVQTLPLP